MLLWCAVCGYFAFVRSHRVPLVSLADLGFHELGHLVMYILPISQILTAAMGSIMQCAVPLGLAAYFGWWRRDNVGMVACLAWASTNFQDASVYIADAPYERLQLIGGEHDWAFVLGSQGLHRMQDAARIASTVRGTGVVILLIAVVLAVAGLFQALGAPSGPDAISRGAINTPAPGPDGSTRMTPDDLCPTTSRTRSADPDRRSTRW